MGWCRNARCYRHFCVSIVPLRFSGGPERRQRRRRHQQPTFFNLLTCARVPVRSKTNSFEVMWHFIQNIYRTGVFCFQLIETTAYCFVDLCALSHIQWDGSFSVIVHINWIGCEVIIYEMFVLAIRISIVINILDAVSSADRRSKSISLKFFAIARYEPTSVWCTRMGRKGNVFSIQLPSYCMSRRKTTRTIWG